MFPPECPFRRLAKHGGNLKNISNPIGHATAIFALKVYAHLLPRQAKNQVDELDSKEEPICTPDAPSNENDKEKGVAVSANPLI